MSLNDTDIKQAMSLISHKMSMEMLRCTFPSGVLVQQFAKFATKKPYGGRIFYTEMKKTNCSSAHFHNSILTFTTGIHSIFSVQTRHSWHYLYNMCERIHVSHLHTPWEKYSHFRVTEVFLRLLLPLYRRINPQLVLLNPPCVTSNLKPIGNRTWVSHSIGRCLTKAAVIHRFKGGFIRWHLMNRLGSRYHSEGSFYSTPCWRQVGS